MTNKKSALTLPDDMEAVLYASLCSISIIWRIYATLPHLIYSTFSLNSNVREQSPYQKRMLANAFSFLAETPVRLVVLVIVDRARSSGRRLLLLREL